MENQSFSVPLQLKLHLLKALREGNYDKSEELLSQLSVKSKTHPQLYQQFHHFVQQHKIEMKQLEKNQKEQENIIIVDAESQGSSWVTDDSVSLSSQESEEEVEEKKETKVKHRLLKNMVNSKSAIMLKPIKQVKRPFFVQTKTKENMTVSTMNLRQSSPSHQLIAEYKSHMEPSGHKGFAKIGSKKTIKPYFPPINAPKPTLKL